MNGVSHGALGTGRVNAAKTKRLSPHCASFCCPSFQRYRGFTPWLTPGVHLQFPRLRGESSAARADKMYNPSEEMPIWIMRAWGSRDSLPDSLMCLRRKDNSWQHQLNWDFLKVTSQKLWSHSKPFHYIGSKCCISHSGTVHLASSEKNPVTGWDLESVQTAVLLASLQKEKQNNIQ